jgi:hypothetical protein
LIQIAPTHYSDAKNLVDVLNAYYVKDFHRPMNEKETKQFYEQSESIVEDIVVVDTCDSQEETIVSHGLRENMGGKLPHLRRTYSYGKHPVYPQRQGDDDDTSCPKFKECAIQYPGKPPANWLPTLLPRSTKVRCRLFFGEFVFVVESSEEFRKSSGEFRQSS